MQHLQNHLQHRRTESTGASGRDLWGERRELLEYVIKDFTRRGGRLIVPPGTSGLEPRTLDQLDISALTRALQAGGPLDMAKLTLGAILKPSPQPKDPNHNPFTAKRPPSNPGGTNGGAGPNPFLASTGGAASVGGAADNPFGAPSAGGVDNPFGEPQRVSKAGAAPENPFLEGGEGARLPPKGGPPVVGVAPATKLQYNLAGASAKSAPMLGQQLQQANDTGEGADAAGALPKLDLPELQTGQSPDELRDLAFLVSAAVCSGSAHHRGLIPLLRQQLEVDQDRAADILRLLAKHIDGPSQKGQGADMVDLDPGAAQAGAWTPGRRASLDLLITLVASVRPGDFDAPTPAKRFRAFLRFKDVAVAVLGAQLGRALADWEGAEGDAAARKRLLARFHGACRRLDVRLEEHYDEVEYSEAAKAVVDAATALTEGRPLHYPWAVRVRLCEILVTSLFDTLEPGSYIDEAALLQQLYESTLWPALGLSAPASLAVAAWVHFGAYVATREQRLVKLLKGLIGKLAAEVAASGDKASDPFGIGQAVMPAGDVARDRALGGQVANHIVAFAMERLSDYHAAFPGGSNMQALLDVFVFAVRSRGDTQAQLAALLLDAIGCSVRAEYQRRVAARVDEDSSDEARLLEMLRTAGDLLAEEATTYCRPLLQPHLPQAEAVAAARLHALAGQYLQPWLNRVPGVATAACDIFRTASTLQPRLLAPIAKACAGVAAASGAVSNGGSLSGTPEKGLARSPIANGTAAASVGGAAPGGDAGGAGAMAPVVAEALAAVRDWDLATPLRASLLQWVDGQVANMGTWAARALQQEKWKPLGASPANSHSQSSVEVARMMEEGLDALYTLDVPLPDEVPRALLAGMDGLLRRYVTHVNDMLGPVTRLIPPLPQTTRYKKDVVLKQETAELDAAKGAQKKSGFLDLSKSTNKAVFLESVPRIEASPDYTNISAVLATPVLVTAMASLQYLLTRTDELLQATDTRQARLAARGWALPSGAAAGVPAARSASQRVGAGAAPGVAAGSKPTSEAGNSSVGGAGAAQTLDAVMTPSRSALETGAIYCCKVLATKAVFWDGRQDWLELLYRHHVATARIDPLLDKLNALLGSVVPSLADNLKGAVATQLLRCCCQALERVILDGGPCRWFVPADVPMIDQDLMKLRALFYAEGEGLDRDTIDVELERVRRLFPAMRVEVGPLMEVLKEAKLHGSGALALPQGSGKAVYDEATAMKLVAHRPEHTGSKMMKAVYKLSKRLK